MELSKYDQIRELADSNLSAAEIARQVGCHRNSVYKVLGEYRSRVQLRERIEILTQHVIDLRLEVRAALRLPPDIIKQRLKPVDR
jgi:hypothetical protein